MPTLTSPRSIRPITARSMPARSPSCSWLSRRDCRSSRNQAPNSRNRVSTAARCRGRSMSGGTLLGENAHRRRVITRLVVLIGPMYDGIWPIRHSSGRTGPPRRRPVHLAVAAAVGLALVSCDGDPDPGGPAAEALATEADARRLAGVCPDPVVVQTSWWPESTHGGLYQLLGGRPTVHKAAKTIRGPLVSRGADTGVRLEIRAGGPARGQQPVAALMRADDTITLGQQATEEQVLGWAEGMPTVGVLAPFYVDPVVFIWDKDRHPDFNAIQDIGQTPTRVFTFRSANTDYLLGSGILRRTQVDYSYDGSPSLFMSRPESVVGGFSTNEPFIYRSMGRDVDYAYVSDTGYPNYRNALTVRADARERLTPCLRKLVPILQRGMVDFMAEPAAVLRRIVSLNGE